MTSRKPLVTLQGLTVPFEVALGNIVEVHGSGQLHCDLTEIGLWVTTQHLRRGSAVSRNPGCSLPLPSVVSFFLQQRRLSLLTVLQSGHLAKPEGATGHRWPHLQWVALVTLGGLSRTPGPSEQLPRGTRWSVFESSSALALCLAWSLWWGGGLSVLQAFSTQGWRGL